MRERKKTDEEDWRGAFERERNDLGGDDKKRRDWQRRREQKEIENFNRNVFEHLVWYSKEEKEEERQQQNGGDDGTKNDAEDAKNTSIPTVSGVALLFSRTKSSIHSARIN